MNILVLGGCGAMGSEATRDLSATSAFNKITVADVDFARAQQFCKELGDHRLVAEHLDINNAEALHTILSKCDIVLNCTSYVFGLKVTEAAIKARKPYLDLGGLYNTPKQLAMSDAAKAAGVPIVLGMGATPGVTNLLAKRGATHMDKIDAIRISFASFRRMAPSPGLLDTVLDEFSPGTVRFYYDKGEFVRVSPFAGEHTVNFAAPVGPANVYLVPHSETHTLPRFIPNVARVEVRGTWTPRIMAALRTYYDAGLLSEDPVDVDGVKVSPKKLLRANYLRLNDEAAPPFFAFYLNVEVQGWRDAMQVTARYNVYHPTDIDWEARTTAIITGVPASIGAQLLMSHIGNKAGVFAPEAIYDPETFFDALAKRKIFVHESVTAQQDYLGNAK